MPSAEFKVGDLIGVVGDNSADGIHRAGYNGLWSLRHSACSRGVFVPTVAGLNHEHIFDGETDDQAVEVFFEPRHAHMAFRKISERESELHQPPTRTFQLESWTKFTFTAPHYVDMEYRCVAHQHVFKRGYIGLFWASYINAPEDKSMYFRGGGERDSPSWVQLCTQRHNDESTVRHRADKTDLGFRAANRESLFRNLSPIRYDQPFYYGNFENLVLMLMFDRTEGIRFTHSPSGGGFDRERETSHPAWDFQFILPTYEVMRQYGFRARLALRPRCSRTEILGEYSRWSAALRR